MEKKIFYLEIYKSIILSLILILLYQKLSTPLRTFATITDSIGDNITMATEKGNRDAVVSDLMNLGALAQQYFSKPPSLGGGGNSFIGYRLPNNLLETANGHYELNKLNDNEIELTGIGNQMGKDGRMVRVTMIVGGDKIISTTNNN